MKKRNSDFKGTPVILPDPLSPHWPIAGFKHLRPEHKILLPKATLNQVEAYYFTLHVYDQSIATCNGGNITISSDAIRESSECITDSTRTPSIVENIGN
jgi:hypothetical protein